MKTNSSTLKQVCLVLLATAGFVAIAQQETEQPGASTAAEKIDDQTRAFRAKQWFVSEIPSAKSHGKAVYGPDNRKDVFALDDNVPVEKMAYAAAHSTCLLTSKSRVHKSQATNSFSLDLEDYSQFGKPPCSSERFGKQKVGGWCSGFLVGPDLVATAGHCCESRNEEAQQIAFVFRFYATDNDTSTATFAAENVYFGKEVVAHRLDNSGDFAIIRLDRAVTSPGAKVLKVRGEGDPASGQVGLIGYPAGLPAKAAFGATFRERDATWLYANLDSYGGNSGSAVFNADGLVEGILVRGRPDFALHNNSCFYSTRFPDSDHGEVVTRATVFAEKIPN